MLIRHAELADLETIVAIEQSNFSPAEATTELAFKKRLEVMTDTFLIAVISGEIAGYVEGPVVMTPYVTDDLFHEVQSNPSEGGYIAITSLSIAEAYKRQGIGIALLAMLKDLAIAQNRLGIVLTCHEELISYYEWNGFEDKGLSQSTHGGSIWYDMLWENPEATGFVTK